MAAIDTVLSVKKHAPKSDFQPYAPFGPYNFLYIIADLGVGFRLISFVENMKRTFYTEEN